MCTWLLSGATVCASCRRQDRRSCVWVVPGFPCEMKTLKIFCPRSIYKTYIQRKLSVTSLSTWLVATAAHMYKAHTRIGVVGGSYPQCLCLRCWLLSDSFPWLHVEAGTGSASSSSRYIKVRFCLPVFHLGSYSWSRWGLSLSYNLSSNYLMTLLQDMVKLMKILYVLVKNCWSYFWTPFKTQVCLWEGGSAGRKTPWIIVNTKAFQLVPCQFWSWFTWSWFNSST